MVLSFAVALIWWAAPLQDPGGAIHGRVHDGASGEPVASAVVEVRAERVARVASTGPAGGYQFRDLPAGRFLLRVRHPGFEPLEIEVVVPVRGDLVLDLGLRSRPAALPTIRVRGGAAGTVNDTVAVAEPDLGMAGVRAMESTPGLAELGLAEAGQGGVPGQEPIDPSDVLYVRGAAADLKLVLLDGAPVYAPFHLAGLITPFDASVLSSARLHLGGAPARYDGGLSYVMDLRTRAGRDDAFHSSGAVDLLSARAWAEGPLGKRTRLLFGGRAVHDFGTAAVQGEPLPYAYADGLLRLDREVGAGALSLTAFRNREQVQLDSVPDSASAGWGNSAASLRYRGEVRGSGIELLAAFGSYDARLPLLGRRQLLLSGGTRRARVAADLTRDVGPIRVRTGASYDRLWNENTLFLSLAADSFAVRSRTSGDVLGTYAEAGWQPAPHLRLYGGLRADLYAPDHNLALAPRLSATWLLNDHAALTLAAGRYHQYVRAAERFAPTVGSPAADSVFLDVGLHRASASHITLGLDQELGEGVRLGLDGFYKRFANTPPPDSGGANASGVDVWVRRGQGRFTGWLGYSLAWVWSASTWEPVTGRFAGRQTLSSGVSGALGRAGHFDIRFAYGAGLPFTGFPLTATDASSESPGTQALSTPSEPGAEPPPLAGSPDEPYLRLDAAVSHTWTPSWRGQTMQISPYLRVLNALGRRDALFYRAGIADGAEPQPIAALPLLPVVGVEWRF